MWISVKLHFSVNTKILEFLKAHHLFKGFRILFFFQILTLEVVKNCFSQKESGNHFFEENVILEQYLLILRFFLDP